MEREITEKEKQYSSQMENLQLELFQTKNELNELKATNKKTFSALKSENETLKARLKQFQVGMQLKSESENRNDELETTSEYEVEAILNHRDTVSGRQYLIRWKGYDSDEDSWENEKNLTCPKILTTYMKSAKL